MQLRNTLLLGGMLSAALATAAYADSQITLIHTGDFHGHLTPRPNLRSNADYPGQMIGGLARIAAEIKNIQAGKGGAGNTLVLHTGDTIQGSGEALYTRGQAIVDVVDMLGIDGYTPGNWDFVYGPERFKELFATQLNPNLPTLPEQTEGRVVAPPFGTRWGGIVSNLYISSANPSAPKDPGAVGTAQDTNVSQAEYDAYAQWYTKNGQRVLPPYAVRIVNGVKIGLLGCTTSRGPQVVGKWVTTGLEFTDCSVEAPLFAEHLRTKEGVDVVVMLAEIEIGRNIQLIKNKIVKPEQHIDVILNADMHEEVLQPIEVIDAVGNKTWIIESGQDGALIGEITLTVNAGVVTKMAHVPHRIDDRIVEDVAVANKVAQVRAPFNEGFDATIPCNANSPYWNSFTQSTCLNGPLSEVVGNTDVALHRSNYSSENMAAAIEGSSHDFIADAIRWWAKSDLATVRGFRYGTHVAPGPITRNDLFHFVPIGPRVGKASRISANQLRNQVDNSSLAVFSSRPSGVITPRPNYNNAVYAPGGLKAGQSPGAGLTALGAAGNSLGWGGGWLFAYSADGFHMNFDPYFTPSWQQIKANGAAGSGIDLGANTLTATPPSDTSRARSLTVTMLCKDLPPAEIASRACNVADTTTRYSTTITTASDGSYVGSWKANYTNGQVKAFNPAISGYTNNTRSDAAATDATTACNLVSGSYVNNTCGYTPYLLNPDGWQYLRGTPNQPDTAFTVNQHFKAPLFTVAGYWYMQSPNTINNCNNCYPMGLNTTVGDANSAYLLPVNVLEDGSAALDANGNPLFERNDFGAVKMDAANKPTLLGAPIDLTVIIEKYLAHLGGTVTASALPLNRIGLVNALPDSTGTLGFPTMQPLCGTIGQNPTLTNGCPQ
ncbi:MAG: bifunctional metallophosphatase/5'-nucleotidase [Gammaproteobacteria bacterium]|nr:bifunctional metallophosphatase/5'-nucleotidase [Gammaproteobacteria bacterium]